eukprot:245-Heterococcus_DN1.PRE.1
MLSSVVIRATAVTICFCVWCLCCCDYSLSSIAYEKCTHTVIQLASIKLVMLLMRSASKAMPHCNSKHAASSSSDAQQ